MAYFELKCRFMFSSSLILKTFLCRTADFRLTAYGLCAFCGCISCEFILTINCQSFAYSSLRRVSLEKYESGMSAVIEIRGKVFVFENAFSRRVNVGKSIS